jgi:hypothetical protein
MENALQCFVELMAEESTAGRVSADFARAMVTEMRKAENACPRPVATTERITTTMENGTPTATAGQALSSHNVCIHCEHLDEWHFRDGDYTCWNCGGVSEDPWNHVPF